MDSEIKDESYPFAKLHMHPEDMAWLRRRWDRYKAACQRLEQERRKEKPDIGVINGELLSIKTHKYHICSTVTGRSKGSLAMLREAFGEDVFEWMSEHGINKIKEESAEKKRKKY
jgi:hypothetical protein